MLIFGLPSLPGAMCEKSLKSEIFRALFLQLSLSIPVIQESLIIYLVYHFACIKSFKLQHAVFVSTKLYSNCKNKINKGKELTCLMGLPYFVHWLHSLW